MYRGKTAFLSFAAALAIALAGGSFVNSPAMAVVAVTDVCADNGQYSVTLYVDGIKICGEVQVKPRNKPLQPGQYPHKGIKIAIPGIGGIEFSKGNPIGDDNTVYCTVTDSGGQWVCYGSDGSEEHGAGGIP